MKKDSQYFQDRAAFLSMMFKDESLVPVYEINKILTNQNLIEKNSFYVVKAGAYENFERSNDPLVEIERVSSALRSSETIIVKNLETWNHKLQVACSLLGDQVSAHMYISPDNGTAFDFHEDDSDVIIHMVHGIKGFQFEGKASFGLKQGETLHIPMGTRHRAINAGWSCHVSFGIPVKSISESSYSYPVEIKELSALLNPVKRIENKLHSHYQYAMLSS